MLQGKCSVCGMSVQNCTWEGKHPKCQTCRKVKEDCPYKGSHPKCQTCGKLKEQCPYNGNHTQDIEIESLNNQIICKLEELKNCTGKTEKECATKVSIKQQEIKNYINHKLKDEKYIKIKEELQELKNALSAERFDRQIDWNRTGKNAQLTEKAKYRIDEITKKIKRLNF